MQRGWSLTDLAVWGSIEAPLQMPGVEIRPGSESTADGRKGSLGTWEIRLLPSAPSQNKGDTGRTTSGRTGSGLAAGASERASQRRVSASERHESAEKSSGSLSDPIVALESRRTDPREPGSSQGDRRNTELPLRNTT